MGLHFADWLSMLWVQVTVYVAPKVAPTVLIPGGNRTVLQSWEVSLQGTASYPSASAFDPATGTCQPVASSGTPLNFMWSVVPAGPDFEFQLLPNQYSSTQRSAQLTIPANFLQVRAVPARQNLGPWYTLLTPSMTYGSEVQGLVLSLLASSSETGPQSDGAGAEADLRSAWAETRAAVV